jgi:Protein of unknown function (DUF3515)
MPHSPAGAGSGRMLWVTVLATLAGCARPVAVAPPVPDPSDAQLAACERFTRALPDSLSTVGERRAASPDSPLTAAYGDPPVSVRCGVPTPAALRADSQLVTVDGVDWFPEELTGGWLMTTTERVADVEITVPTEDGPAPSVAADLAATITATLPPA